LGEVLKASTSEGGSADVDGSLLRAVTVEDDLMIARMERNREEAYAECVDRLDQRQIDASLMEVEHLFDGQSIYFYFLGEVTPEIESVTAELAEAYETKVQFREFTDAVERGCGPDCGTESAAGCGTGCSSCAVASACKK
jgi:cell fate regulator YaaT (PSP1 superfamily)